MFSFFYKKINTQTLVKKNTSTFKSFDLNIYQKREQQQQQNNDDDDDKRKRNVYYL